MGLVMVTALGVGGATVIGGLLGLLFGKIPHKWNDGILGFAAGIMLAAAVLGLIIPSVELVGKSGMWITILGIMAGALFLAVAEKLTPHLHQFTGLQKEKGNPNKELDKVLLFVLAIAIHNFPEGLAAGVGFGGGDLGNAISVATGIALQNIPEGMIVISPLVLHGISKKRAFAIAAFTGLIEVVGTLVGYFTVVISSTILPFALAFAGGTMLFVISNEMIPETHSHGYERMATATLILGFCVMLIMDTLLN